MSKTWKEKPDKYIKELKRKPKEGKRFESSKGRKKQKINLEDYIV